MGPLDIQGTARLLLGLLIGFIFGFLLQKGRVTKYEVIVNAFRLKDFTVYKVMLSAILVGAIGVYFLRDIGLVNLHLKPFQLGAIIIGGLMFGVGMALLGYCPGTGVGAVGEGSVHALVGMMGGLIGAALYAELYGKVMQPILGMRNFGQVTFPQSLGISHWIVMVILGIIFVVLFTRFEKWKKRISSS